MSEEKKLQGSKPKLEPQPEEMTIRLTVPVQVVSEGKEIKAALLIPFTGEQKLKELFLLSYMQRGLGQFWKNKKIDILLAEEDPAKALKWKNFLKEFKLLFKLLDIELDVQMKLRDLKMKECTDEYTYQFQYLADQTRYNDAAQIEAFKQGLP
uniref:Retrotransposon gag domain-containing protein n=1 Tax=Moniliophthora roreri TaxID=221103 RepID=A0A0W0FFH2_MONRR